MVFEFCEFQVDIRWKQEAECKFSSRWRQLKIRRQPLRARTRVLRFIPRVRCFFFRGVETFLFDCSRRGRLDQTLRKSTTGCWLHWISEVYLLWVCHACHGVTWRDSCDRA